MIISLINNMYYLMYNETAYLNLFRKNFFNQSSLSTLGARINESSISSLLNSSLTG